MKAGPHGMPGQVREIEADFDSPDDRGPRRDRRIGGGKLELRRWDGATTHRLNAQQFESVTGRSINEDLVANLRPLIDRCCHVATTNGVVEGMIESHSLDIVGADGPAWQVLPRRPMAMTPQQLVDFSDYCCAAEEYLEDWCNVATYNEDESLSDIMEQDIHAFWTTGNAYSQILNSRSQSKGVGTLRLHPIHSQRILHNYHYKNDGDGAVVLGTERDKFGKALNYLVQEQNEFGSFHGSVNFTPVPAHEMLHSFKRKEPGQFAGVPMLSSVLPNIGDESQFSKLTIEAAKIAASMGIVFTQKWEGAPTIKNKAGGGSHSAKLGAASIMTAPSGHEAKQITSEHPAASYEMFSDEQWRTVGRPSQMPLSISRLKLTGLSYSAARMEVQLYQRSIRRFQSRLRRKYSPTLNDVLREAELAGRIPMRPVAIQIGAAWGRLPEIDQQKSAKAREIDLKTMSKSLLDVWAEQGQRPHVQAEKLRRTMEVLESVRPGLGEAYVMNLLQNTAPEVLDTAEGIDGNDTEDGTVIDSNEMETV